MIQGSMTDLIHSFGSSQSRSIFSLVSIMAQIRNISFIFISRFRFFQFPQQFINPDSTHHHRNCTSQSLHTNLSYALSIFSFPRRGIPPTRHRPFFSPGGPRCIGIGINECKVSSKDCLPRLNSQVLKLVP